ncbi:uncharacterized protein MYCFIDRAFT_212697 [Pseudocercospora fijiensis CIRAD86]|uniref:Uncharacterized protein n=1 Tax=Pseudocercospora fijiensis (strain CIRAD86) TaxID=383855 RepID=M3AIW4_PSEFD|nr:uncharacterized protein MYCFIDRAFT_212697 [Pseudocercospora fijiensis CIRAD86]EME77412.1 hypothetical protein MYCFIDRAFT_212697 [Pseudocercospora fijiensis CIRAD86]
MYTRTLDSHARQVKCPLSHTKSLHLPSSFTTTPIIEKRVLVADSKEPRFDAHVSERSQKSARATKEGRRKKKKKHKCIASNRSIKKAASLPNLSLDPFITPMALFQQQKQARIS